MTASAEGNEIRDLATSLNALLADLFALYVKTKSFHWHMSGPHFRDWHLLLDEQADQILAVIDVLAERVRKIGASTLTSVGHVARLQRIRDNDQPSLAAATMLVELRQDNRALVAEMKETHALSAEAGDVATTSLLENFIDEGERRIWFLAELAGPAV
ncbi:MAG TPA: DNA starvation/stationary phase protection protein [Allosphingosinicella sp.]